MVLISAVGENLGAASQVDSAAISGTGDTVAFFSSAQEFGLGPSGSPNLLIWRRDREPLQLASTTPKNQPASGMGTGSSSLSNNGSIVRFGSDATDLVKGDTNESSDIFLRSMTELPVERVSVSTSGAQSNGHSYWPSISGDGKRLAFQSYASNLVPNDTNEKADIFLRDRTAGTTTRISLTPTGEQTSASCKEPAISGDGTHIAFSCFGDLTGDPQDSFDDVYLADLEKGTKSRISASITSAVVDGHSNSPSISNDGQFIAFTSQASNLVPGDTNDTGDVFVYDRLAGTTERISVSSDGKEGDDFSGNATVSGNGRYIVFSSLASNLVPDDSNGVRDVFVRDREAKTTVRVSTGPDDQQAAMEVLSRGISADGQRVLLVSGTENFGANTDGVLQIWLKHLQP